MRTKRMLSGCIAALAATSAMAQSDGRSFDAAVVLTPGMALERGGLVLAGTYDSGLLRHGDVIYTENSASGSILTSDGTVIGIGPGAAIAIDGRQSGFSVFQVLRGSANILGNVHDGYPIPSEFSANMPLRFNNIVVPQNYGYGFNPPPSSYSGLPWIDRQPRTNWSSSNIVIF